VVDDVLQVFEVEVEPEDVDAVFDVVEEVVVTGVVLVVGMAPPAPPAPGTGPSNSESPVAQLAKPMAAMLGTTTASSAALSRVGLVEESMLSAMCREYAFVRQY